MTFNSATHSEIEEPYTPVNKDLYPDRYEAWKDSVWSSIRHFGVPLDYNQSFQTSYQLPLNLLPIFDWVNADAAYESTYHWVRGTDLDDGTSLGNDIVSNRTIRLNGTFNMEKLYNHIPFLKKTNERFNKEKSQSQLNREKLQKEQNKVKAAADKNKTADGKTNDKANDKAKNALPKNSKSFEKEITLMPDTTLELSHGKKTKRFVLTAKTENGKPYTLKYKKVDENKIKIFSKVDSAMKVKVTITPKDPLDEKGWYKAAQVLARLAMSVRSISFSYRNQYSMSLPGFMPTVGKAFGQTRSADALSPGLDFAFGFMGDSYVDKAKDKGWLHLSDSVAAAGTNNTDDLQLRVTLEPVKNLKIDLNASRTKTTAKSVQFMYKGNPTTLNGTFTMTTMSLKSAFDGIGDASSGYQSKSFTKFCNSIEGFRGRVEAQYKDAVYPNGTTLAGKPFDPANGQVNSYSSDVLIPAFLAAYTSNGGSSLNIFPALSQLLPNWTLRYSGLGKLPWFRDVFKSVNINHSYKSIYSVGAFNSYSNYVEYMDGLGFVADAMTGNPVPSSMYNVSTVSINEAFSPLLGVDVTLQNNLTCKLEYRTTRVLTLSMTSIQVNEAISKDWVIGAGYKINNFSFFASRNHRAVKGSKKGNNEDQQQQNNRNSSRGKTTVNHDLNLRLDLSLRKQASITRDIATVTSSATSGNTAFKLSFSAEYTLSKLMSMSFYFNRQTNTPLLASNSYPTTTQDFGLSIKMSLTR
jgi:cell surface protein SprA